MTTTILIGDCRAEMAELEPESVHCVVTSPPYWGLRNYSIEPGIWGGDPECAHVWGEEIIDRDRATPGTNGSNLTGGGVTQAVANRFEKRSAFCTHCNAWRGTFGLEPTYQLYVEHSVEIFRAVKRILRADGTLWLNLGDSYATGAGKVGDAPGGGAQGARWDGRPPAGSTSRAGYERNDANRRGTPKRADGSAGSAYFGPMSQPNRQPQTGLKAKDLCGIPWRVAFALQADGWYLRRDIIWHKPNAMPESTTDRCTTAHEYLFHFSKSEQYFYDGVAIEEEAAKAGQVLHAYGTGAKDRQDANETNDRRTRIGLANWNQPQPATRNKRSVWTVSTKPFPEAHFATFPPDLIEPCILAGTSEHGCCPDCGAGWERITAEVETGKTQKMPDGMATYAGSHTAIHKDGREEGVPGNPVMTSVTLGFYPTCDCSRLSELPTYPDKPGRAAFGDEILYRAALMPWRAACKLVDGERKALCASAKTLPVKPATVFDPFFGAGTTGLVSQRLKRNAIGCELNPDYAKMAQARLESDMMTKESGRRHMARALNKEKPWTAETLFAQNNTGDFHAGTDGAGDDTG